MKILRFTLIVAIISILSRFIGFIREAVIANELGVSNAADAVYLALTIPNIFQLVLGASVANALIPFLSKGKRKDNGKLNPIFGNVIIYYILISVILSIIIIVFLDYVVLILAPELNQITKEFTKSLILILLPASILIGVSAIFRQVLQMEEKVIISNVGQLILNTIVIATMFLLSSKMSAAYSLVFGMVLGSLITILLQYYYLNKIGYRIRKTKHVKEAKGIFAVSFTIMLGLLVDQLYNISNRIIASGLTEGSIAALSYGERVIQLPLGIVAQSLGIVIFPMLALYASSRDTMNLNELLHRSLKIILLISIPISIIIFIFNESIITILFGRGEFDTAAINFTSIALKMFAFMLLGQSVMMILTRFYYAIQKPKIPLYTVCITIILNVILSYSLRGIYGHAGIAFSNTISMTVNAFLLIIILRRYNFNLKIKINLQVIKYFFSLMVFVIICFWLNSFTLVANLFVDFFLKAVIVILCYIITLIVIKEKEIVNLIKKISSK